MVGYVIAIAVAGSVFATLVVRRSLKPRVVLYCAGGDVRRARIQQSLACPACASQCVRWRTCTDPTPSKACWPNLEKLHLHFLCDECGNKWISSKVKVHKTPFEEGSARKDA